MRQILIEWNCKFCDFHTYIKTHQHVSACIEKSLVARVMDGSLFYYQCPKCHHVMRMMHPFMYHNSQKNYLICMDIQRKDATEWKKQFTQTMVRFVENPQQLREKILIFENGMYDGTIELIKLQLKQQMSYLDTIYFEEYDKNSNTIWFQCEEKEKVSQKAIMYDTYVNYCKKYQHFIQNNEEVYVDEGWAKHQRNRRENRDIGK